MISLVIPAYNEEETIGKVIKAASCSAFLDEIIVVNDGSIDATSRVARRLGVKVIDLEKNRGKGGALSEGIKKAKGEILVFLDADLVGLRASHVKQLLTPILTSQAEMTVGLFPGDPIHRAMPQLSGQRALKRKVIEDMPNFENSGFGFETILSRHCQKRKIKTEMVWLKNLSHLPKEAKYNPQKARQAKFRAFWQIIQKTANPFSLVGKFLLAIFLRKIF